MQTYRLSEAAKKAILSKSDSGKKSAQIENQRERFIQMHPGFDHFGKSLAEKKESSKMTISAHNRS